MLVLINNNNNIMIVIMNNSNNNIMIVMMNNNNKATNMTHQFIYEVVPKVKDTQLPHEAHGVGQVLDEVLPQLQILHVGKAVEQNKVDFEINADERKS